MIQFVQGVKPTKYVEHVLSRGSRGMPPQEIFEKLAFWDRILEQILFQ